MNICKKIIDIISAIVFIGVIIGIFFVTILSLVGIFVSVVYVSITNFVFIVAYVVAFGITLFLIMNGMTVVENWIDNHVTFKH